jgi:hypothetical protein
MLFQIVDDIIDGDGLAGDLGVDAARAMADQAAARAHEQLALVSAETHVLDELVAGLVVRQA